MPSSTAPAERNLLRFTGGRLLPGYCGTVMQRDTRRQQLVMQLLRPSRWELATEKRAHVRLTKIEQLR